MAYIIARQHPTDNPPDPTEPSGRPTVDCWLAAGVFLTDHKFRDFPSHPPISTSHSISLSSAQSILAICRPWPRFTVCRRKTQQSTGGEGGLGKMVSFEWLFFLLFKTKSNTVTLKTKQEEVESLAAAWGLALGVSSDAAAQRGSCRARTCG